MNRIITSHVCDKVAVSLITALDEPGPGGANHRYSVSYEPKVHHLVIFQNGPINEDGNGVNGLQNEDFLAILIDRMRGFQSGPYACADNQDALDHLEGAMEALQRRTKDRVARGVEGTHEE